MTILSPLMVICLTFGLVYWKNDQPLSVAWTLAGMACIGAEIVLRGSV